MIQTIYKYYVYLSLYMYIYIYICIYICLISLIQEWPKSPSVRRVRRSQWDDVTMNTKYLCHIDEGLPKWCGRKTGTAKSSSWFMMVTLRSTFTNNYMENNHVFLMRKNTLKLSMAMFISHVKFTRWHMDIHGLLGWPEYIYI